MRVTHTVIRRALMLVAIAATLVAFAPETASAQHRGHAVPRGSVRGPARGPSRVIVPARPYYYRTYRPAVNFSFFYGYPGYYGAYRYGYPAYGYYGPYRYGWVAPYGYGYDGYSGRPYGGLRIDMPDRDAEVFVDGYFVGIVDDFDGRLQQANIEAGPHRIEVREDGYEPLSFDVRVEPGRTITYRGELRPIR